MQLIIIIIIGIVDEDKLNREAPMTSSNRISNPGASA